MVKQVGGDHYQTSYIHWDWVCDVNLHYLLGNATKYIARYEKKGSPKQDLEKAVSYLRKAIEREVRDNHSLDYDGATGRFLKQFDDFQKSTILSIYFGNYEEAIMKIKNKLAHLELHDINSKSEGSSADI